MGVMATLWGMPSHQRHFDTIDGRPAIVVLGERDGHCQLRGHRPWKNTLGGSPMLLATVVAPSAWANHVNPTWRHRQPENRRTTTSSKQWPPQAYLGTGISRCLTNLDTLSPTAEEFDNGVSICN